MENEFLVKRLLEIIPKDSIGRYDLLPVFKDESLFIEIIQSLANPFIGRVDYIAAPEAIGWIIGSAMAIELNTGFIPIRKINKLPYPKDILISQSYVDYTKINKSLEIKYNSVTNGDRVLIVDEWVESGETMRCCINLLEKFECNIIGLSTIGIDYHEQTKDWIDTGFIRYIGKNI